MVIRLTAWFFAAIAASAWAPGASAAARVVPVPPATEILKTLRPEHPRLLMTADDFAGLKRRVATDTLLTSWNRTLAQGAEAILNQPPSGYAFRDGKRLLDVSRLVKERVRTLGLMYRLTGDRRLADRAWTELEAAGTFRDWNPSHFLDAAEITAVFAIGYDWLFDVWTPPQRAFLRRAIIEKGIQPSLKY